MFSPLRNRFGIPGVISVIALVFAMIGGAYAASNNSGSGQATASAKKGPPGPRGKTGKQGPPGATGPAGPTGPAGAKGDTGAAGSNGTNGKDGKSITNTVEPKGANCSEGGSKLEGTSTTFVCNGKDGKSITNTVEPKGANCTEGGSKFVGSSTTFACNGSPGSPWTAGGTLPSKATETGLWAVATTEAGSPKPFIGARYTLATLSFFIPLTAGLNESHTIYIDAEEIEEEEIPAECENTEHAGTAGPKNPEADPGFLCVYEVFRGGMGNPRVLGFEGAKGATIAGAVLKFDVEEEAVFGEGSWAVTG